MRGVIVLAALVMVLATALPATASTDDRICATGRRNVIDGGSGYDRCQGPDGADNTFRGCEMVVER